MVGTRIINLDLLFRGLNVTGYKICNRLYSVFPTSYVSPVYRKEEQQKLAGNNGSELEVPAHIKPAPPNVSSSEFFNDTVRKMTNLIMRDGKKDVARQIMTDTFTHIKLKQLKHYHNAPPEQKSEIELDPKVIFLQAVNNCTPVLHLINIKRGGMNYEVPTGLSEKKAEFMAMKWLIEVAKQKDRKLRFSDILARDILDAYHNTGRAVKLKQALHRKCDENRAYAHYRWMGHNATRR